MTGKMCIIITWVQRWNYSPSVRARPPPSMEESSNPGSTATVHTSATARVTSVAIRIRIRLQIRIWIPDPDRHRNLTICSSADCQPSLKISCKSVRNFWRKVANKQKNRSTYRQTDNDENISSLAEVIMNFTPTDPTTVVIVFCYQSNDSDAH